MSMAIDDKTTHDGTSRTQRLDGRERSALDDLETLVAKRLRYIRLAQEFAELANSAESIEDGVTRALRCFCRVLGWPVGHAYLQADSRGARYVDRGVWWIEEGLDADSFVEASSKLTFEPGMGFVGRVIETAKAQWAGEEVVEQMLGRSAEAVQAGLKCGIAFPILVQSRVAGVLEFYSHDVRRCEREPLDAVAQLGTQLGRVIERAEFERDLARVSQEERRELGRELHDTLSQQLTGIGMLARSLERKLEDDGSSEAARARNLLESIEEARGKLRAVARGLNPVDVDAVTLSRVVADFAQDTEDAFDVRCRFEERDALCVEDDFTANQLFCIIREAVHNAAKHAHADLIEIEARRGPDQLVELSVRDDGDGFDVEVTERPGMGLRTLRYRARLIGARLRIDSRPGRGTSVACTFRGEKQ